MENNITQEQLQQELKDFEHKLRSDIAHSMILNGLPAAEVSRYTNMPIEWVQAVLKAEIHKLEMKRYRKKTIREGAKIATQIANALKENIPKDQIASMYDVDIDLVEEIGKVIKV